jgi:hypothetical protein
MIVRLVRIASWVICLIVVASFVIFVVDQSSSASAHQTQEVTGGPSPASGEGRGAGSSSAHESGLHKAIDEASDELTSPFAGLVSGSSSEWVVRGVKLLLALVVYGLGVGFLARVVLVRV